MTAQPAPREPFFDEPPSPSSFIWSVADLMRGDYIQSEYGRLILPFTVVRRLDCVMEATKPAVQIG
jgi:type I restriction enzyme M protein